MTKTQELQRIAEPLGLYVRPTYARRTCTYRVDVFKAGQVLPVVKRATIAEARAYIEARSVGEEA
jgi:hypothetical protein